MQDNTAPTDELALFLAERLGLSIDDLPQPGIWAQSGNTIGAIALRMNLLTIDQVDDIINAQETESKLFGQIAIELGFIDKDELDRLLELQRFHWSFELGELLFVRGDVDLPKLLEFYVQFAHESRGDADG